MKKKRIIQLELNEISKDLLENSSLINELPNFRRILSNWHYASTTSENVYERIEPWIQWVTVHTGKSFAEHGIFRLSESEKLKHSQIWEVLSQEGIESNIFGCMNATRGNAVGGIFFPDPWAKGERTYPARYQDLWNLISYGVQAHAAQPMSLRRLLGGLWLVLSLRVPLVLLGRIGIQIIRQKLFPRSKWKLAALFDEFLAELFMNEVEAKPAVFNALFLNCMAHYQHHYWRNHDKEKFSRDIKSPDCHDRDDPIRYGLKRYDAIIGKIMKRFDPSETVYVILTGLTQVPYLKAENVGGMNYYRLRKHAEFCERAGLQGFRVYPMMSRDWQIEFATEELKSTALAVLTKIKVGSEPLFSISEVSPRTLFLETQVTEGGLANRMIVLDGKEFATFGDYFSSIAIKTGSHSGDGHFWCSDPVLPSPKFELTEVFQINKMLAKSLCAQ